MSTPPAIRDLRPDELDFLGEMLYAALDWRADGALPILDSVLDHPLVAMYHRGWGRPGDTALVAEAGRERVGVVWYRFFTAAEHGEGYVDDETPELAIAVVESWRGRGVGGALLRAIHERAREQGIARIALSVDPENPAKRLYELLGYVELDPADPRRQMVFEL